VLGLQPRSADVELMGFNLMNGRRRVEVMEQARRTVATDLRRLRTRPYLLPQPSRRTRRVRQARRRAA
jgi:hypothetical protein